MTAFWHLDEHCCVRVEVPVLRADGTDGEGRACATGTGYPVGADLILTARHVVVRPEDRDPRYPIRVWWIKHPDFGQGGCVTLALPDDAALAWVGPGEHDDLALLRCPERPPGVAVPPWPFAPGGPRDDEPFRSLGYPSATRIDETGTGRPVPRQNSFRGTLRLSAEPWFEIVDPHAPGTAEDWQGASGMPIFTARGIVGVFSAALARVTGKGHCVPVAPLLDAHLDLAALFPDDGFDAAWEVARERARKDTAAHLARSPRLAGDLRQALDAAGRPTAADADARVLAKLLADLDFATFADLAAALDDRYRESLAPRPRSGTVEASTREALRDLVLRLAPFLYDRDLARGVRVSARRADLIEVPAALYAVAELMVAAEEGRAAGYQRRKDRRDRDPRGLACLSAAVPELGYNATDEDYCEHLQVHLGRKELSGEAFLREPFLTDCDRFLARFYLRGRPLSRGTDAQRESERRRGVDQALADWEDDDGRPVRFYTVFRPEGEEEFAEMYATALILHRRYPSLRIVFLTALRAESWPEGKNPWDRDRERLRTFCRLIPIRQSGPEGQDA